MLTIAWDVDDVLNNLMEAWLEEAWKPTSPAMRVVLFGDYARIPRIISSEFRNSITIRRWTPSGCPMERAS